MTREEARSSPKPNQQGPAVSTTGDLRETAEVPSKDPEVTKVEEGNLKMTDQTMIPNQIIRPGDGKLAEQQERKTERSLLFMITAGVVCQTMSHDGYGWCVTLLTLVATGVQGREVNEP